MPPDVHYHDAEPYDPPPPSGAKGIVGELTELLERARRHFASLGIDVGGAGAGATPGATDLADDRVRLIETLSTTADDAQDAAMLVALIEEMGRDPTEAEIAHERETLGLILHPVERALAKRGDDADQLRDGLGRLLDWITGDDEEPEPEPRRAPPPRGKDRGRRGKRGRK